MPVRVMSFGPGLGPGFLFTTANTSPPSTRSTVSTPITRFIPEASPLVTTFSPHPGDERPAGPGAGAEVLVNQG